MKRIHAAAEGGELLERREQKRRDGTTVICERFSRPDWTAAAWFLERVDPERFGRRERREISGPAGGPISIEVDLLLGVFADIVRRFVPVDDVDAAVKELGRLTDEAVRTRGHA